MSLRGKFLRACVFTSAMLLGAGHAALASDPLPGDDIAPPVNVNIGMLYNEYSDAGSFGAIRGTDVTKNTRISNDIIVGRYIHTFDIGSLEVGVQAYVPFVQFLGTQELGINNIPTPVHGLPDFGPGKANLSNTSGFGQPNLGVFAFPVNDPVTGTYVVLAPWISPPVSSFNKNSLLNPGQNSFVYEMEIGIHKLLIGTPKTTNLGIEVWGEAYGFADNGNSADVNPEVSANNIPAIYGLFGVKNPLQNASSVPATFHEQPSGEVRVYLPYEFYPATGAFFTPGFYQSFGGKQTYTLKSNGEKIDSGNRTDESQLRIILSTFISPTTQVTMAGYYDVAAHGQPLNRTFLIRVAKFF
jgi:hypothetical protein